MARFIANLFGVRLTAKPVAPKKPRVRPSLENLETRELPATGLIALNPLTGIVSVNGSNMSDMATVTLDTHGTPSAADDKIMVRLHNSGPDLVRSFARSAVHALSFAGLDGNDFFLNATNVPALVNGGAGGDFIRGGSGNDVLTGGAGHDTIFGGAGNDIIHGDLVDGTLSGGLGSDQVIIDRFDPSVLVHGDANQLKTILQAGLSSFSMHESHNGESVTVNHLTVNSVTITNGVTKVFLKADFHYKKTQGFPQFSTSGSVEFNFQPAVDVIFNETGVQKASVYLTNLQVTKVSINHLPSWLANNSAIRNWMASQIQSQPPLDVTGLARAYINAGNSLGPVIQA